jgi:beta-aspartyl-peptidase (threonine type)
MLIKNDTGDFHLSECVPLLVAHAGAGDWSKVDKDRLVKARGKIFDAVSEGYHTLISEGAVEAVVKTISLMEESGVFNAGRGSVANSQGIREMDAGIMDGYKGDAGAVALLRGFPKPIEIALEVMRKSPHVILGGEGAYDFALKRGFSPEKGLLRKVSLDGKIGVMSRNRWKPGDTVGAVAVDKECHTAAGASTGGVRGKMPGRIGDSPIPGAGFYANRFGAASATGIGEVILLTTASRKLIEMAECFSSLEKAGELLLSQIAALYRKDTIGIIAVDTSGHYARFYNTKYLPVSVMGGEMRKPRVIGFPSTPKL